MISGGKRQLWIQASVNGQLTGLFDSDPWASAAPWVWRSSLTLVSESTMPGRFQQAFFGQPFGVEQARVVALAVVAEDGDDAFAGAELFGQGDGSGHVDAAG